MKTRWSRRLADYLNQLLGRAHNLIYMGRQVRPKGILYFYQRTFPEVFRATFNYTLLAFAIFASGAVAGLLASLADPGFQRYFLGPGMTETIERHEMLDTILHRQHQAAGVECDHDQQPLHLIRGFRARDHGRPGTVFMLVQNGLLMGVISAACWQAGMSRQLAEFVTPHGVLELPAIFIAGGAGLLIARGLLFPGQRARRDALVFYSSQAIRLVLGIIPLVVAGIVEVFVSPTTLPAVSKFLLAAGLGGVAALYVTQAGKPSAS